MLRRLIIAAALVFPATASAQIEPVLRFRISGANVVDRVDVKLRRGAHDIEIRVCSRGRCSTRFVSVVDRVQGGRVVDLAGAPTNLNSGFNRARSREYRLRVGAKRWPVLVLRTYSRTQPKTKLPLRNRRGYPRGSQIRNQLILISLRRRDYRRALLFRKETKVRGAYGHGHSSGFTLVRGTGRVLEIAESRRRLLGYRSRCRPPNPTRHRHVLTNGRFRKRRAPPSRSSGCH